MSGSEFDFSKEAKFAKKAMEQARYSKMKRTMNKEREVGQRLDMIDAGPKLDWRKAKQPVARAKQPVGNSLNNLLSAAQLYVNEKHAAGLRNLPPQEVRLFDLAMSILESKKGSLSISKKRNKTRKKNKKKKGKKQ